MQRRIGFANGSVNRQECTFDHKNVVLNYGFITESNIRLRARVNRDFTVPVGSSRTSEISEQVRPSISRSSDSRFDLDTAAEAFHRWDFHAISCSPQLMLFCEGTLHVRTENRFARHPSPEGRRWHASVLACRMRGEEKPFLHPSPRASRHPLPSGEGIATCCRVYLQKQPPGRKQPGRRDDASRIRMRMPP